MKRKELTQSVLQIEVLRFPVGISGLALASKKIIKKTFAKPIDKIPKVWYNIYSKGEGNKKPSPVKRKR